MYGNFKTGAVYKRHVKLFDLSANMNSGVDGHIANESIPSTCYNFKLFDGALKDGVGVEEFSVKTAGGIIKPVLPENAVPVKAYFYKRFDEDTATRDDRIMVYCDDGYVYGGALYGVSGEEELEKIEELIFDAPPFSENYRLNGKDVILFSSGEGLFVYDGENVEEYEAPEISAMRVHNERLFITTEGSGTELWFSKTFDPTNWNVSLEEAGMIDFRDGLGKILALVSFNGYLYLFRDYGITRLSGYADQTEFYTDNVFVSTGKICGKSVTAVGKYVVYLAEDGFYRFNGEASVKILGALDKNLTDKSFERVSACSLRGCYYIATNLKIDGADMQTLVCYDVSSGDYCVSKGLDVIDLCVFFADEFSVPCVITSSKHLIGKFCDRAVSYGFPLQKTWKVCGKDYGIEGMKTLTKVYLYTKSDVVITVESEFGRVEETVVGKRERSCVKIGLKGKTFDFSVKSSVPMAEISKINLEFEHF